jgi:hypothetical protein
MNICGGMEIQHHLFLTSVLDRGHFTPDEGNPPPPNTLIRRLGGLRYPSRNYGKEKTIPCKFDEMAFMKANILYISISLSTVSPEDILHESFVLQ